MAVSNEATLGSKKPRSSGYPAWRLLIILMVMNIVAYLDRSVLTLAAPAIQADLDLSHVQMSLLIGIGFVFSYVIIGIPAGWLVDRAPRRIIVSLGVLTWSLSASAAGLARSFMGLMAARIGIGAGEATLHPAAYSMIADAVPRKRLALALTLFGGSSGAGAAISVAIGGLLMAYATTHGVFDLPVIGQLQPWQWVLLLSGLPGLVVAASIYLVPEPLRRDTLAHTKPDANTASVPEAKEIPLSFAAFLRRNWMFVSCSVLGFSFFQILAYGFSSWHPTYMVTRFGWDYADTGLALSIGMLGAFVGAFVAGWVVDQMVERGITDAPLRWSALAVLFSSGSISAAFMVDDPFLCVALVIMGQFPLALIGVVSTALQQGTPNEFRGRLSAIFLLVGNLIGFGAGPLLPAMLTDYVFQSEAALGQSIAIVSLIAGPIAAILFWLGMRPMRKAITDAAQWRD